MTPEEVVIPVSALGLAAGAIYRAGSLTGAVKEHGRRLDNIEEEAKRNVTRGELDARFAVIDAKIDKVLAILAEREP